MQLSKRVDNLCLYDPEFKFIADKFLGDLGGSSDICEVTCMETLKSAIKNYKGVKFLEIVLHGDPGTLYMGRMVMAASYIGNLAKDNLNFLQKNAQILFDSCSVGEGKLGDKFMDELGASLLKGKGGVIGATTVDNRAVRLGFLTGVYMEPLSFGRLKVKKYDENGKMVASRQVDRHGIAR